MFGASYESLRLLLGKSWPGAYHKKKNGAPLGLKGEERTEINKDVLGRGYAPKSSVT